MVEPAAGRRPGRPRQVDPDQIPLQDPLARQALAHLNRLINEAGGYRAIADHLPESAGLSRPQRFSEALSRPTGPDEHVVRLVLAACGIALRRDLLSEWDDLFPVEPFPHRGTAPSQIAADRAAPTAVEYLVDQAKALATDGYPELAAQVLFADPRLVPMQGLRHWAASDPHTVAAVIYSASCEMNLAADEVLAELLEGLSPRSAEVVQAALAARPPLPKAELETAPSPPPIPDPTRRHLQMIQRGEANLVVAEILAMKDDSPQVLFGTSPGLAITALAAVGTHGDLTAMGLLLGQLAAVDRLDVAEDLLRWMILDKSEWTELAKGCPPHHLTEIVRRLVATSTAPRRPQMDGQDLWNRIPDATARGLLALWSQDRIGVPDWVFTDRARLTQLAAEGAPQEIALLLANLLRSDPHEKVSGFPSAPYDLNRQRAVASTFNRLASSVPPIARQVLTTLLCATSAGNGTDAWAEVTVAAISLDDGTRDARSTARLLSEALDEGGPQAHHGLLLASTTRLGLPHDVLDHLHQISPRLADTHIHLRVSADREDLINETLEMVQAGYTAFPTAVIDALKGLNDDVDDWRSIAALLAAQPDPNTTPGGAAR